MTCLTNFEGITDLVHFANILVIRFQRDTIWAFHWWEKFGKFDLSTECDNIWIEERYSLNKMFDHWRNPL